MVWVPEADPNRAPKPEVKRRPKPVQLNMLEQQLTVDDMIRMAEQEAER